jgi:hypothetical protein
MNTKLFSIPKTYRDSNEPTFQVFEKNAVHQADLLFLPTDRGGFKYLLVIVDAHTRLCDAMPLKIKTAQAVLNATKKIYAENTIGLKYPKRMETDPGTEFKGVFQTYLKSQGTYMRYGATGRHRQQAIVEHKNLVIGRYLLREQTKVEHLTNRTSKAWLKNLPKALEIANAEAKPTVEDPNAKVHETTANYRILAEGTPVRYKLEFPIDYVSGKRLIGKFRSSDIRWSKVIYKIKQILLKPGFPPMYLIDKDDNVARTKHELQVVKTNFV